MSGDERSMLQRELRQTRPFMSRAQEATVAIMRTADVLRRRVAAVTEPHGITPQQYNVLRILRGARGEPLATLEIGNRLIERMPGTTRLLDRLEEKALVRRERSAEDRRLVHCWITEEGLALLARLDEALDAVDNASAAVLSGPEIEALIDALERIRAAEP